MPRPASTPWGRWSNALLATPTKGTLTFTECNALKQAHATGRFSKASLARMYDTQSHIVDRVIKNIYRYHREE